MERLTKPDWKSLFLWECCGQTDFCLRGRDKEKECVNCIVPKLYARVAMFEDAGVPMQKTIWMKEVIEEAFDNDTSRIERAHELHVADKEGRVVVLPCKVGDTIYFAHAHPILQYTVTGYDMGKSSILHVRSKHVDKETGQTFYFTFSPKALGDDVFLTREEAEKALQGMEGKG